MARMSKLQRSQRAHTRLMRMASKNVGLVSGASKKFNYHSRVLSAQEKRGEVLTKTEKRSIWKNTLSY